MGAPTTTETREFREVMNRINQTRSNLDALESLIKKYPLIAQSCHEIRPGYNSPTIFISLTEPLKPFSGMDTTNLISQVEHDPRLGRIVRYQIEGVDVIFIDDLNEVR